MDFELNEEQQAILESVNRLLAQQAGPARAIELNAKGEYDHALQQALQASGFTTVAHDFAQGDKVAGLEAALIVEAIARSGGVVSAGAQILVAATACDIDLDAVITLCTQQELLEGTPIRYAAHAEQLLCLGDDSATLFRVTAEHRQAVKTSFGYPMGRITDANKLEAINTKVTAERVRDWWQVALAVEATGTMEAALDYVVDYLKQRRQFGRAIGSFQAIQHRLALCAIQVEATRWLGREAAFHGAPAEGAAAAAAFALDAADQLFTEMHQMSGAIGFTHGFDLHVWSMRLLALRQELGGVRGARRALVEARWGTHG